MGKKPKCATGKHCDQNRRWDQPQAPPLPRRLSFGNPNEFGAVTALFEFDLNGIVLAQCGVIKFQSLADAPHFDPYNAVRLRIKVSGAAEHVGSDGNGFEAIPAPFQFLGNEILNQSPLTIRGRCQTVLENRCQALKQCFFWLASGL